MASVKITKAISLCMIVGNVEIYIERCLNSFFPIADEVCIVRAIGGLKADKTMDLARAACEKAGKPLITSEYYNKVEHAAWPHVDNFAAARQMSFDISTGDYCFWCDSDDVLESGAEHVRELANQGGYAGFVFPYKILGRGMNVPRERMMAKDAGKWVSPIHEHFKFIVDPVQAVEDQRVIVKHIPHLSKTGSPERNLTILNSIPESEMTTGLWYHLHLEREIAGDQEGSIEAAKRALDDPKIGKPEKYEIFLNLAQSSKTEPEVTQKLLLEAYGTDPTRREALLLLANNAMNFGSKQNGLAFARQMMITPMPESVDWNSRKDAYGWVGEDIYAQALRLNGRQSEAEMIRKATLKKAGGPRIALIHATRGRPERASIARKIWLDQAEKPDQIEHIFVIDDDDKESFPLKRMHHLCIPAGGGCVSAWNHGAFATTAPVMIQLSDDWIPVPGWDDLLLSRIGDTGQAKVLAISDGFRKDNLLCMAIMTRSYWSLDWFMFHPWFTGVYSDNWFTEQAYARGAVIEARDIVLNHMHPLKEGIPMDETYQKQNAPERYAQGRAVMDELRAQTDWSSVPGFFNYWPVYEEIARGLKDGDTVAEVGVWLGRSIIYLAQLLKRQGKKVKLLAVDHFKGESNQKEHEATVRLCGGSIRAAFEENIKRCGVADIIEIIEGDSAEMALQVKDGALAFCFIDAAHDYESVKRDISAWKPKLKPGAILAGHDAEYEGVKTAVKELLPNFQSLGPVWIAK